MIGRFLKIDESGTTLVELMIGAALLIFVLSGAFTLNYFGAIQYRDSAALIDSRGAAARASRIIGDDVRQAKSLSEVEPALISADNNGVAMYLNADGDAELEKVRYFLSGTDLQRGVSDILTEDPLTFSAETVRTVGKSMANDSNMPLFRYFRSSGVEATALPLDSAARADIRLIRIAPAITGRYGKDVDLETKVFLRNTKPL